MIQSIMGKFPKLNPDWLILGTGDMYKKMVQTSLFSDPALTHEHLNESIPPEFLNIKQPPPIPVSNPKASENPIFERRIESVIIFYNDKTFTEYCPG